jgi:hypothetical protein
VFEPSPDSLDVVSAVDKFGWSLDLLVWSS